MKNYRPAVSVVIPVRNERESLEELVAGIRNALGPWGLDHELLFVDDGSTDDSLDILQKLASEDPRVRVFALRRGFGKSTALECGFHFARGEYIVTMDGDLQDDPLDIAPMLAHLQATGTDVVSGWRRTRRDSTIKVVSSWLFNFTVRLLFGAAFRDMNSGIKLYRARVARELHLYGGMHRFIPLIATEMGFRVSELPVRHHERRYGTSKYSPTKVLTQIPDLLTVYFLIKFTRRPLHFFGRVGSLLFAVGFVCLLYLTILWTQGIPIGTRPLLTLGVLLIFVGGQIVFTGLLADLIVNVNHDRTPQLPLKYASDAGGSLWSAAVPGSAENLDPPLGPALRAVGDSPAAP